MTSLPPSHALILVAVMTSRRDLEIARLLGWYRIPLRSAPKVVSVDYLALYQTGGFGKEGRWRIQHFAEVRGHELTSRAELFKDEPEHPHAREEYFKLQLGSMQTLPQPILAGNWRRITFLYTTGDLFNKARTVNDLVVRSEERQLLWRSLRERAIQEDGSAAASLPELELDPAVMLFLGEFAKMSKSEENGSQGTLNYGDFD
jgi:hypothetical protein